MEPKDAATLFVDKLYAKVNARLPMEDDGKKGLVAARVAIGYYSLSAVTFHMRSKLLYQKKLDDFYWFGFVAVIGKIFGEWKELYSLEEIIPTDFERNLFSRFTITFYPVENTAEGISEFLGQKRNLREIYAILIHFRLHSYQAVPTKHAEVSGQLAEKDIFLVHLWVLGGSRIHEERLELVQEILNEIYHAVVTVIPEEDGA